MNPTVFSLNELFTSTQQNISPEKLEEIELVNQLQTESVQDIEVQVFFVPDTDIYD
jgi:hypothetical protein